MRGDSQMTLERSLSAKESFLFFEATDRLRVEKDLDKRNINGNAGFFILSYLYRAEYNLSLGQMEYNIRKIRQYRRILGDIFGG